MEKKKQQIDLKEIYTIVRKRKWFIIIPVIIITAIAYAGTHFLTPQYRSSTIVWIDKPSTVSTELERLLGGGNRRESREEQRSRQRALQAELTSKLYLSQLIQDLHLGNDQDISREAAKMRESNPDIPLETIKENLLIERLREQISVSFHGADQIRIRVETDSPVLARDIASRLTEIMEQEKTRYEMEKILDNQNFTDEQLRKMERYYKEAIDSLNDARARLSKLQLPENITSEANRLDILSTVDKISIDQNDYKRELNSMSRQLKELKLDNVRLKYTDTIVELRTNIDGLISDYAGLMERYTWNDQNVINVNIRINDYIHLLESAIESAVNSQYSSYPETHRDLIARNYKVKENHDILNSKQNRLRETLTVIDQRINLIPQIESEIVELTNRVANYGRYRDAFRTEEATVDILSEQTQERTKYKIIEPAKLPLEPFWPDKKNIIIIGFLLGFVLGGAFVFIAELLDDSFKRIEDIEEELGIDVIAAIPKIEKFNLTR